MKNIILPAIAAALFLTGPALSAQEQLVSYDFAANLSPTTWSSTVLNNAPNALSFTGYSTAVSTTDGARSAAPQNIYARVGNMGATQATASSFSFTLTPLEGKTLDLGQLAFDAGHQNTTNPTPHPTYTLNYQVGIKVGGGNESILPSVTSYAVPSSNQPSNVMNTAAVFDLSSFAGISSSVTLTIYLYATNIGAEGPLTQNQTARMDNIVLTTAASTIPEPSSAALVMGGLSCLAVVSRRVYRRSTAK